MQYELSLPAAGGSVTRRMTTLHVMLAFMLCGIGAGCFALYWFTSTSPKFKEAYTPFLVFGLCSFLAGLAITAISVFNKKWLMQGKRSNMLRVGEVLLLAIGCGVFLMAGQKPPALIFGAVAAVIAVAAVWESRGPTEQKVVISEAGISLPRRGIRQVIKWREIEAVLLRHGILTIELIENKLIQHEVKIAGTDAGNLEAFTRKLIEQYAKERAAYAAW